MQITILRSIFDSFGWKEDIFEEVFLIFLNDDSQVSTV